MAARLAAARLLDHSTGGAQQRLNRIVRHLSAPAPPSPRFALIEPALFLPAALFFLPKTLFFLAAAFFVPKALFFLAAAFFVPKALFFPVQFWLTVPKVMFAPSS